MTQIRVQRGVHRLFAAASISLMLALGSGPTFAADSDKHEDRAEARVTTLHAKLKITPAQEEQWNKVAAVMKEDGERMDTLTQARTDHGKSMTAVDDLKSYEEIAQAHAVGIKKLSEAFGPLYASMSTAQKAEADNLFRNGPNGRATASARAAAKQ
jgi:protein CpxP